jgi:hypothetical protein
VRVAGSGVGGENDVRADDDGGGAVLGVAVGGGEGVEANLRLVGEADGKQCEGVVVVL